MCAAPGSLDRWPLGSRLSPRTSGPGSRCARRAEAVLWESHGRVLGEFVEVSGCSERADASSSRSQSAAS